jgi:hypothetical protein
LEGDGDRKITERTAGRRFDRERGNFRQTELALDRLAYGIGNAVLNRENHEAVLGTLYRLCKDEITLSS